MKKWGLIVKKKTIRFSEAFFSVFIPLIYTSCLWWCMHTVIQTWMILTCGSSAQLLRSFCIPSAVILHHSLTNSFWILFSLLLSLINHMIEILFCCGPSESLSEYIFSTNTLANKLLQRKNFQYSYVTCSTPLESIICFYFFILLLFLFLSIFNFLSCVLFLKVVFFSKLRTCCFFNYAASLRWISSSFLSHHLKSTNVMKVNLNVKILSIQRWYSSNLTHISK